MRRAPEPAKFDALVRRPGLDAIRELTGKEPSRSRPGPRRKQVAKRAKDIPPEALPALWANATDLLLVAYEATCAYACLRISVVTGVATTDHWAAKSRDVSLAYEWTNYRLACLLMNTRKRAFDDVLDPFEIEQGWFALDLVSFAVVPGPTAEGATRALVEQSIGRLGLDGPEYKKELEDRYEEYRTGMVTFAHLEKWAPFLASELRRQGKLKAGAQLSKR